MLRKFRGVLVAVASAGLLFTTPAPSYAIFHWFRRACGCGSEPVALSAPVVETAPVVAPTVVNYVPQTCYRTQYVTVPVTTYRPFVTRDACTGCPVTAMRPTMTYVQQARRVPYTTYRAVVTSAPAVATSYSPVYAAPRSGCSSCSAAPAAAPIATAPASQPYYNAAPISSAPASSNGTGIPTLAPGVSPGVSNFQRPIISSPSSSVTPPSRASSGASSDLRQKPIVVPGPESSGGPATKNGDANGNQGTNGAATEGANAPKSGSRTDPTSAAPRLINPDDRTTQRLSVPVRYAVHRVLPNSPARGISPVTWRDAAARALPVSAPAPASQPSRAGPADADGWRPSNR